MTEMPVALCFRTARLPAACSWTGHWSPVTEDMGTSRSDTCRHNINTISTQIYRPMPAQCSKSQVTRKLCKVWIFHILFRCCALNFYFVTGEWDINNLCLYRHEIGTFTFQWIFTIFSIFSLNENYVSPLFGDEQNILSIIVRNFYFASANILA